MIHVQLFLLLFISISVTGQNFSPDSIYLSPEIPAKFKYGDEELKTFIASALKVPFISNYYGINGEVNLTFTVDTLGKIKNIKVNKEIIDPGKIWLNKDVHEEDVSGLFSDESKRIVLLLNGLYKPALNKGIPVSSLQTLSLTFTTLQYKKNEHDYQKQFHKGKIEFHFGAYKDDYNKSLDTILFNNGVLKLKNNKAELACLYFEEAIGTNPDYLDAYYNLGVAYLNLKKFIMACEAWKECKKLGDKEVQELIDKYCF